MTVFSRRLCVTKPFSAAWQHWDQASGMPECEFGGRPLQIGRWEIEPRGEQGGVRMARVSIWIAWAAWSGMLEMRMVEMRMANIARYRMQAWRGRVYMSGFFFQHINYSIRINFDCVQYSPA